MTPKDFIIKYGPRIVNASRRSGLLPSVVAAQMALETGWGEHITANNAFGIKAAKGDPSVSASTLEFTGGKMAAMDQDFREYNSVDESIVDHGMFLRKNPRYEKAGVFRAKNPSQQAEAIHKAGYATDPDYSTKLISIIKKHGLEQLDADSPDRLPQEELAPLEPISRIQANTLGSAKPIRTETSPVSFRPATEGLGREYAMQLYDDPSRAGEVNWVSKIFPIKEQP
jgi:hypothetical protein